MSYDRRLAAARAAMGEAGVGAMVVSGLVNIRYLTGFTGSNALVVIGPETATLLTDFRTLFADKGDATKVQADLAKLKADQIVVCVGVVGDIKVIQDLITNNATVKAARDKLTTDAKPISDDLAKLQADYQQLAADLKAQREGTGGTGGTGGTTTV